MQELEKYTKKKKKKERLLYLATYKTHPNFSWAIKKKQKRLICHKNPTNQTKKKQSTNIKLDEINIMNIINDNVFNLHQ